MVTKKEILIIEDEKEFAGMVKLRLELLGYTVSIAEDTNTGIEEILKGNYVLVVLDLMLPGGGGFTILERIQNFPEKASIPVVVLTGKTIDAEIKKMLERYKVAALFTKPYDEIEFEKKIKSLVPI